MNIVDPRKVAGAVHRDLAAEYHMMAEKERDVAESTRWALLAVLHMQWLERSDRIELR